MFRVLAMLLFISATAQAGEVRVKVFAFDEATGRKLLQYKPSDDGFRAWMQAGFKEYYTKYLDKDQAFKNRNKLGSCTYSDYYHTPCMVGAQLHAMQKSLADIGIATRFTYQLEYTDRWKYGCKGNCVRDAVMGWQHSRQGPLEVLLMPQQGGSHGFTRSGRDMRGWWSTSGWVAGGQQAFAVLHLARHELSHAMGFNGHLYDAQPFTFNPDGRWYNDCKSIEVKPYSQSGLQPSCANRTFVGNHSTGVCNRMGMGDSNFFSSSFDVPVYRDAFKHIFGCWVANYADLVPRPVPPSPAPQPKPEPQPEPKPEPHKYCQTWLDLVDRYQCKR